MKYGVEGDMQLPVYGSHLDRVLPATHPNLVCFICYLVVEILSSQRGSAALNMLGITASGRGRSKHYLLMVRF